MGRTSDAQERLINAACELFQARGYGDVGVKDICDRAGVNKGSFYHFFPSKQELAIAAIESYWRQSQQQISVALAGDAPPLERISKFLDWHYEYQRCARLPESGCLEGCPLGNLALELSTREEPIRQALEETFRQWVLVLEPVLDEAMRRGDIEPHDPADAASELIAYLEGVTLLSKTRKDLGTLKTLRAGVVRLLGVRSTEAGPSSGRDARRPARKSSAGKKARASG